MTYAHFFPCSPRSRTAVAPPAICEPRAQVSVRNRNSTNIPVFRRRCAPFHRCSLLTNVNLAGTYLCLTAGVMGASAQPPPGAG